MRNHKRVVRQKNEGRTTHVVFSYFKYNTQHFVLVFSAEDHRSDVTEMTR